MRKEMKQPVRPELKTLVAEATQSLAKLDPERLEELAFSCQALNGAVVLGEQNVSQREAREARREMAALAKVLEATRANASVMSRLRELHAARMQYSPGQQFKMSATEVPDGHH